MVHDGERQVRPPYFSARFLKSGKGLRRSALVDQVAVNIDE